MARELKTCSCGALFFFARTVAGKPMPVDAEPHPAGTLIVDGADVRHAGKADPPGQRWMPHHATCPDVSRYRRKK